ncbi:MAG: hypothetical protein DIU69_12510, partial [Bacillota bacterium]
LRGVPLSAVFRLLRQGRITVNGRRSPRDTVLRAGDVVEAVLEAPPVPPSAPAGRTGQAPVSRTPAGPVAVPPPDILYEDEDILVVNKPAGVLVHPGDPDERGRGGRRRGGGRPGAREEPAALVDQVRAYLALRQPGAGRHHDSAAELPVYRPSPVHRLDRNTSGLVAFGKTRAGAERLSAWFRSGQVEKEYLAVVEGDPPAGELRHRLRRDRSSRLTVAEPVPGDAGEQGRPSPAGGEAGSLAVLRLVPVASGSGFSLVRVWLVTGRTHQIRAQLAATGHALAGDVKYGGRRLPGLRRPALHCYRLAFPNGVEVVAPLPEDLVRLCRRLGLEVPFVATRASGPTGDTDDADEAGHDGAHAGQGNDGP